jgi:hypothetical protein
MTWQSHYEHAEPVVGAEAQVPVGDGDSGESSESSEVDVAAVGSANEIPVQFLDIGGVLLDTDELPAIETSDYRESEATHVTVGRTRQVSYRKRQAGAGYRRRTAATAGAFTGFEGDE